MDFIQTIRATELAQKFVFWSNPVNMDNFYGNLARIPVQSYGIETFENAYIKFFQNRIIYKDLISGNSFWLRQNWNEHDHICHQELCENSNIRISRITYKEIIELNGCMYEYSEMSSPLGVYGAYTYNISPEGSDLDPRSWTVGMGDEAYNLISKASAIAKSKNCGIPTNIVSSFSRFKDNEGYYWEVGLDWTDDPDFVLEKSKMYIKKLVLQSPHNEEDSNFLINYLEEKWKI
jgi:hypothetical protein